MVLAEPAQTETPVSRRAAWRWLAFALAIAGCLICLVLLRMTIGGPGDAFSAAVCSPGAKVNCDYVLSSPFAKIGPLPAAAVGLAYFTTLGAWILFVGVPSASASRWRWVPLSLALIGVVLSVWYVYVMAVRLPVWCTWCLAAHVVNGLLFVAVLRANSPAPGADGSVPPHPTPGRAIGVLAGCAALFALIAMGVLAFQAQLVARQLHAALLEATNNADYIVWRWQSEPAHEIPVREDDLRLGADDAPHTLVVFTDFECEKCGWFGPYAQRLLQAFPKSLRIVYKQFPVSPECNPGIKAAFHVFACDAALAALAAVRAGSPAQAAEFHDLLYKSARLLGSRPYSAIARKVGIDSGRFETALDDPATRERLARDVELGSRLGVTGTPAMFLDGRRLATWHIRTDEMRPRIDVARTDALWSALMKSGTPPAR